MSRMLQISSKERKSQGITWEYSLHIRKQTEVGEYGQINIGLIKFAKVETLDFARAMFKGHPDPSLFLFYFVAK
jgi:hypothetical protein